MASSHVNVGFLEEEMTRPSFMVKMALTWVEIGANIQSLVWIFVRIFIIVYCCSVFEIQLITFKYSLRMFLLSQFLIKNNNTVRHSIHKGFFFFLSVKSLDSLDVSCVALGLNPASGCWALG